MDKAFISEEFCMKHFVVAADAEEKPRPDRR